MAERAKKLIGGYVADDIVKVSSTFQARRTPPPLATCTLPCLVTIPQGTHGMVLGIAAVVGNALDIMFDTPDGFVRVETELRHIARI